MGPPNNGGSSSNTTIAAPGNSLNEKDEKHHSESDSFHSNHDENRRVHLANKLESIYINRGVRERIHLDSDKINLTEKDEDIIISHLTQYYPYSNALKKYQKNGNIHDVILTRNLIDELSN